MQRHYSDPQTQTQTETQTQTLPQLHPTRPHAPQRPSRLNPATVESRRKTGPAVLTGRGTVSMPSSPLRRAVALPWAEPGSAQTFFGYGGEDESKMDIDQLFLSPFDSSPSTEDHTLPNDWNLPDPSPPTSSDPFHLADHPFDLVSNSGHGQMELTPDSPFSDLHQHQQDASFPFQSLDEIEDRMRVYDGEPEEEGADEEVQQAGEGTGARRKKRQQVRVACTHCQKACKKCSNTRPCERCVKYGLEDCVDSTRKPRKTGVKRGPYKRRTSKYASSPIALESPFEPFSPRTHQVDLGGSAQDHAHRLLQERYRQQQQQSYQDVYRGYGRYEPIPPGYGYAQGRQPSITGYQTRQPIGIIDRSEQGQHGLYPPLPRPPSPSLPAPRPSGLESALSAALSGLSNQPRWVNGQRVAENGNGQTNGKAGTLMPHTPTVPFPLSLQRSARGEVDPFSRAVSPIRTGRGSAGTDITIGQGMGNGRGDVHGESVNTGFASQESLAQVQPESQSQVFGTSLNEGMLRLPSVSSQASTNQHLSGITNGTFRGDVPSQPGIQGQIWSAPTSPLKAQPQGQSNQETIPTDTQFQPSRSISYQNTINFDLPQSHSQSQTPVGGDIWSNYNSTQSPATIALKRIRKPSLRTLIVPGISREGTPVSAGPVSGTWNPGLSIPQGGDLGGAGFNGGMRGRGDGTMSPTLFPGSPEMEVDDIWAGQSVGQGQRHD